MSNYSSPEYFPTGYPITPPTYMDNSLPMSASNAGPGGVYPTYLSNLAFANPNSIPATGYALPSSYGMPVGYPPPGISQGELSFSPSYHPTYDRPWATSTDKS
ncbi:hypothetical protein BOTBODRAFT_28312 [Botryobasidium botryosum FD-172 SS1]|uniref:Uncharacterized protein n=1 Tax=Botryobasidium botryosum (strain FD-172 SS1) TaxID=930990 RepID=A0A067MSX4_BOTB1|nr:hypothetical protein BOTBODRAFT_28312 [Botryobasidium botryosum FD-172 SS1]